MNEFSAKWAEISTKGHSAGRFRVFPDHPLDFFLGYSSGGKREVIVEARTEISHLPAMPEFRNIDVLMSQFDGGLRISVTLIEEDLSHSFGVMCYDLAQRSKRGNGVPASLQIFLVALNNWAELFRKKISDGLSRSEAMGLYGELLILEKLINEESVDQSMAIQGWRGPDGDARDIGFNGFRIEVKTQLSTKAVTLKISSLDQLDDRGDKLYVALNRISPSDQGISLAELVRRIGVRIISDNLANSEFERKLELASYSSNSTHANEKFGLDEEFTYIVEESFPRLTPNSVPKGIRAASYEITGAFIEKYKVGWEDMIGAVNV